MTWKFSLRSVLVSASALAALAAAACSGGGGGAPPTPRSIVSPTSTPMAVSTLAPTGTTAVVTIRWPDKAAAAAAHRRRPNYLSDGTESVTINVDGQTTEVDNPNLTTASSAPTQATSAVTVIVTPTAAAVFTVSAYDQKTAMGKLLGSGSATTAIVKGQANPVGITLNGNLGVIACSGVSPFDTPTGTAGTAFQQAGITGDLILVPKDPDGYTIVMPGTLPTLSLAAVTPAMASTSATSTANEFQTTVTPTGTAETFNATGTDLAGDTISTACTITRDALMYVVNQSTFEAGGESITEYDETNLAAAGGTDNATPIATIAVPAAVASAAPPTDVTAIVQPQYPAVDSKGYLFVTNSGPMPGSTYGPTAGYVAIYAPGVGQSGNVAPVAYISGLDRPGGIAFDKTGNLYVLDASHVFVYPPNADGVTAPAVPSNTITGAATDLFDCYGLHVDAAPKIYTACSDVLNVFAAGATGNATPTEITPILSTSMTFSSYSWLDVAADSTGEIYAPGANNNVNEVFEYMSTASGAATPTMTTALPFSQPEGIFIDPADEIFVTNFGSNSVDYFSTSTPLLAGIATSTLSGTATGLNHPVGVVVR